MSGICPTSPFGRLGLLLLAAALLLGLGHVFTADHGSGEVCPVCGWFAGFLLGVFPALLLYPSRLPLPAASAPVPFRRRSIAFLGRGPPHA